MKDNPKSKKIELIVIVVTAIIIAFLASFLASYIFEFFKNESYFKWIIYGAFTLIILSIILLYSLILSNVGHNRVTITIPLTFSNKDKKFLDLPFNQVSVQTRVNFDKLPREGQIHLATYDSRKDFFKSELNRFINHSLQSSVISRILEEWKFQNKDETDHLEKSVFPNEILENHYLKDWFEERGKIYAPSIEKIESFGPNNSYVQITTKYGTVKFTWNISYMQTPYYSKYFFDTATQNHIHDFIVSLTLNYRTNPLKSFSKGINRFHEWCEHIENKYFDLDWKANNIERMLILLKEVKDNGNSNK